MCRGYPNQLTTLSNLLVLHQPRNGWVCYPHILAEFWRAATCHSCWMWLPHPGPCVESLTLIGSLPRRPQRDPYIINLTDSWLYEQRAIYLRIEIFVCPAASQGPRKLCCMQPPPPQCVLPHQTMSWQSSSGIQNLGYPYAHSSPTHGKRWGIQWDHCHFYILTLGMRRIILKLKVRSSWL